MCNTSACFNMMQCCHQHSAAPSFLPTSSENFTQFWLPDILKFDFVVLPSFPLLFRTKCSFLSTVLNLPGAVRGDICYAYLWYFGTGTMFLNHLLSFSWVSGVELITDPYVWAACIRYQHTKLIKDRVNKPSEPFLLIHKSTLQSTAQFFDCMVDTSALTMKLVSGGSTYTMSKVSGCNHEHNKSLGSPIYSFALMQCISVFWGTEDTAFAIHTNGVVHMQSYYVSLTELVALFFRSLTKHVKECVH